MKTNEAGIKLIKDFEKCKLEAYKPISTEKFYTIGYGHYGVVMGTVWTQAKADEQFFIDVQKCEKAVEDLKRDFNENEFSALVSFCFNLGAGNLKTLCKGRTNAQIANALLLYNKSKGKVLEGLNRRRKEERKLFLTAVKTNSDLPYKVITSHNLRIRKGPGTTFDVIRVVKKGTELTVWAVQTNEDGSKWAKSWNEYFCLDYCERI